MQPYMVRVGGGGGGHDNLPYQSPATFIQGPTSKPAAGMHTRFLILQHSNALFIILIQGLLQLAEVEWAALHVDETLRMSALSMLCTDVRITTVPVEAETKLLQKVIGFCHAFSSPSCTKCAITHA